MGGDRENKTYLLGTSTHHTQTFNPSVPVLFYITATLCCYSIPSSTDHLRSFAFIALQYKVGVASKILEENDLTTQMEGIECQGLALQLATRVCRL